MFALKRFDAVVVLLFYTFSEETLGVITIRCLLQENSEGFGRNFTYPKCLACTAKSHPHAAYLQFGHFDSRTPSHSCAPVTSHVMQFTHGDLQQSPA